MESFDFTTCVFYAFSLILLMSATMVVSAKNSVYSVFFLILAFFNAAGLFVLLGAEYLAMTLVIVYVGAVAVLFLFVVMMLNINYAKLRASFLEYLPLGALIALILFIEIGALLYSALLAPSDTLPPAMVIPLAKDVTNTHAIGQVLYTHYAYLFQLAGLVLLVAMIGANVLTLRHRPGVKRQRIGKQVARKRDEAVEIVSVESGQGV